MQAQITRQHVTWASSSALASQQRQQQVEHGLVAATWSLGAPVEARWSMMAARQLRLWEWQQGPLSRLQQQAQLLQQLLHVVLTA
jgi:hypothetical protein